MKECMSLQSLGMFQYLPNSSYFLKFSMIRQYIFLKSIFMTLRSFTLKDSNNLWRFIGTPMFYYLEFWNAVSSQMHMFNQYLIVIIFFKNLWNFLPLHLILKSLVLLWNHGHYWVPIILCSSSVFIKLW